MSQKKKTDSPADTSDLYENRLAKLDRLRAEGYDPYMQEFHQDDRAADLLKISTSDHSPDRIFHVAGRIRTRRIMGKAAFMDLEDDSGRIQLYGNREDLGESFPAFKQSDLGDIVGVTGYLFQTKTGQTTLHLKTFQLLAKCLRPLPVVKEADGQVFDAFADKEQRYRMRYVDLIVNPEVRRTFEVRSRVIQEMRHFLNERGFLEVETPMMHPIPGGASARPFVTHHNTLDMDLYLRIAPELYLKRLVVGGFSRVYEVNRNFRNEGISIRHNPEFTMLELYEAFGNMEAMLELCQHMIAWVTRRILGTLKLTYGEHEINLEPPWPRLPYIDAIQKYGDVKIEESMSVEEARQAAMDGGVPKKDLEDCNTVWQVAEVCFDELVEAKLIQPVFITDFPVELSPLAKAWPDRPMFTQRFEPYIVGREIGNAFSELNDPQEQERRFMEQVKARESGSGEGGYMDHDYIRALEFGMPPTGGLGIGIDRLVMILTNSPSIRDTILFPQLRPESKTES